MKPMLWAQKSLFFFGLIFSFTLAISSESFLGMWLAMEMNLIFIIPIFLMTEEMKTNKVLSIYFIVQSIASVTILISHFSIPLSKQFESLLYLIFVFSIFMKLGMFPFHFWIPMVMEGISWKSCYYLSVLQKIIPLMIISTQLPKNILFMFIIMNSLSATINGLNQYLMRKIMAFSSINHLSYIILSLYFSKMIFVMYFFNYMLVTILTFTMFDKAKMNYISQIYMLSPNTKMDNLKMIVYMNSMAGVPPFSMFVPKVMTIILLVEYKMMFLGLIIMLMSIFATFFYLRISFNSFFCSCYTTKKVKLSSKEKSSISIYTMLLLFTPILYLM